MNSPEYAQTFDRVKQSLNQNQLTALEKTVPLHSNIDYPIHECACVNFLAKNYEVKIGPKREVLYDNVINELGISIRFTYLCDAYALATKQEESVIHYSPFSRGTGQRLFLGDTKQRVNSIFSAPDKALRYYATLGSYAGFILNKEYISLDDINYLHSKKLKKIAKRLVVKNILEPLEK